MKKFLFLILIFSAGCFCFGRFLLEKAPSGEVKDFGITFSKKQADELGLNWREVYLATLEELGFKKIRVPVYWQDVESEQNRFDFSVYDEMIALAQKNNAEIILAIGVKLPRWPECHEPEWAKNENPEAKRKEILEYMEETINRYDKNPAIVAWQIENEPFLGFGKCEDLDVKLLDEEIVLTRSLSKKPVLITDSGEMSGWFSAYKRADIFGTTMYRTVYNKIFGQITYPLPPVFFRLKLGLARFFYLEKPAVVIELQAEPWDEKHINEITVEQQYKSMSPEKFQEVLEYIKGTGFDTFYLWGVEWWYQLKQNGHPEMWDMVKALDK
ncbi:MAG: beta-galactosidase [Candidatus Pacebacteria bacterium]|nr:beta-galactosidase [Candidatus Paceibacterota bacterium]